MPQNKLPTDLSGRQVRQALERSGFVFSRQHGSHVLLYKAAQSITVVVPDHKQVRVGTLKKIIRDAKLTTEEFLRLLE